jgi:hypothetical protein
MLRRSGGFASGAACHGAHRPRAAASAVAAATSHGQGRRASGGRVGSSGTPASTSSITIRASPIAWTRRRVSFSRHPRSSRRTLAGVSGGSAPQSGSLFSTEASVSAAVSPPNSRRPLNIS